MGRIRTGLTIAGAASVIVPLKIAVYHRLKRKWEERQKLKRGGLRFDLLSRDRQRQVLYYRRSQLQDYENTYRHGMRPRFRKYGSN